MDARCSLCDAPVGLFDPACGVCGHVAGDPADGVQRIDWLRARLARSDARLAAVTAEHDMALAAARKAGRAEGHKTCAHAVADILTENDNWSRAFENGVKRALARIREVGTSDAACAACVSGYGCHTHPARLGGLDCSETSSAESEPAPKVGPERDF